MLELFIHSLEVALLSAVAFLVYKIRHLSDSQKLKSKESANKVLTRLLQGNVATNVEYEIKMDSLKKAQIFAGIQLLEIKRNYSDLNQDNLEWLREAISLYLIGAVDLIGKEARCGTKSRKELISLVLKSNLSLSTENSSNYFQEALYRKFSSDNDLMVRAGAKAAKVWLSQNSVPKEMSLVTHLDGWGVFA
jgi:hypothetical protein